MATKAKIVQVRFSGSNWLCDVEVNGKVYKNVMVSAGAVSSGNKNLMLKDIATRLYNLLHRDEPITTPIDGEVFDIETAKDYQPPAPEPDLIQQKKARLRDIYSKKDVIKKAIEDGLITSDDEVVKELIKEAKALIKELKEAGENPFD